MTSVVNQPVQKTPLLTPWTIKRAHARVLGALLVSKNKNLETGITLKQLKEDIFSSFRKTYEERRLLEFIAFLKKHDCITGEVTSLFSITEKGELFTRKCMRENLDLFGASSSPTVDSEFIPIQ